jgi:hypothetical protein
LQRRDRRSSARDRLCGDEIVSQADEIALLGAEIASAGK